MSKKRLLILRTSKTVCGEEVDLIQAHAQLLGMDVVSVRMETHESAQELLSRHGQFDYFYLCTHGNRECFEVSDDHFDYTLQWEHFAVDVCASGCLKQGSTFLMACCRGGLNRVAYDMFIACPSIDFICGPSAEAYPTDLTTAFVVFLLQLEAKRADQWQAAEIASTAIGRKFICFDRNVVEGQADYNIRKLELWKSWGRDELGHPLPSTQFATVADSDAVSLAASGN